MCSNQTCGRTGVFQEQLNIYKNKTPNTDFKWNSYRIEKLHRLAERMTEGFLSVSHQARLRKLRGDFILQHQVYQLKKTSLSYFFLNFPSHRRLRNFRPNSYRWVQIVRTALMPSLSVFFTLCNRLPAEVREAVTQPVFKFERNLIRPTVFHNLFWMFFNRFGQSSWFCHLW